MGGIVSDGGTASEGGRAGRPYVIGDKTCWTKSELAAGLTSNFAQGVQDLEDGKISQWLERQLNDSENASFATRQAGSDSDVWLLRLALRLDPGLSPTWWGHSLAPTDLHALVSRAVGGDGKSKELLEEILRKRVLLEFSRLSESVRSFVCEAYHVDL